MMTLRRPQIRKAFALEILRFFNSTHRLSHLPGADHLLRRHQVSLVRNHDKAVAGRHAHICVSWHSQERDVCYANQILGYRENREIRRQASWALLTGVS